jgi:hypothetical protein
MSDIVEAVLLGSLLAVIMSPFLGLLGLPWIFIAWLFWRCTKTYSRSQYRVLLTTLLVAVGVAPFVYAHGVINLYIVALWGGGPPLLQSFLSIIVTWVIVYFLFKCRPIAKEKINLNDNNHVTNANGNVVN